ncbi:MAG: hypothetical protein A2928_02310 [Candidatus Taylorbacteria bacterium RIFCSPLOWO2_01_FULL_45_15b]|uniref:Uncharacterized protein n=1 Tax=Candidatus Taylorbacteria bacterium RIFCSPLOWO2_01_FULL_45_15b TaxID=1802319 RepID=A0A1G2NE39_9BACT|nr:MAG: hypothetical protein A2928_02310 [Candidatus Taylorbacteria bacterium RIFCSPLOWO2_01_FULL_45_15b]
MKKANEEQARKFAGVFVEHHPLLTMAPHSQLQWAIQNPQEAILLFVEGLINRAKQAAEKVAEAVNVVKTKLALWKTIDVGGTTKEKLLAGIEEENIETGKEKNEIRDYARDLTMQKAFVMIEKPEKVDLVILTPRDFGLETMPETGEFLTKKFLDKWSEERLDGQVVELLLPEDGPQLRKQYQDQPKGEVLFIAMERIADSGGSPSVFVVGRGLDGVRWLDARWTGPGDQWSLDFRRVFRLRTVPSPLAT